MSELSLTDLPLPMSAVLGLTAAGIYLVGTFRSRRGTFTVLDTVILVLVMGVVTAATAPVLDGASQRAKSSALQHNLHALKQQIELYKVEHDGVPPLVFRGGFPQLVHATNSKGVPGPRGPAHPLGPYLPAGVPVNPYTGSSVVKITESFPPDPGPGTVGWLYHQPTGRIAPDLPKDSAGRQTLPEAS